ncbi:response regulator [Donghicola tyrosinivorans]|uniref:CheY-like chemotaxis protein n=1 Tax=Donghicola tyrosinivorans TaxID=1652492 RepID=A0A2T0X078_9RHOB|nr:response regulator [Donghicola tyrosinivorans]PRY92349.1 CheY-like chemotaxis protein [Donghicola tyrosinivorans]
MHITFIEDDDLHAEIVTRWLKSADTYSVERFKSPSEFMEAASQGTLQVPDLVFVDYNLGEMTGDEFIREMRNLSGDVSGAGVVLFSGLDEFSFLEILEQVEVDGFLMKDDLSREKLFMVIKVAARSAQAVRMAARVGAA